MRKMLLTVIVFLLAVVVVHGEEKSTKTKKTENQSASASQPETQSGSVVIIDSGNSQPNAKNQSDSSKQQPEGYFGRLFSPENLPTIALVIVGIVTFIAIWIQAVHTRRAADAATQGNADARDANAATLIEIQRQASVMERQATVMEDQAKMLVTGERAWVLVENPRSDTPFWNDEYAGSSYSFEFDLKNHGRTVARLMDFRAEVYYLKIGEQLPTSPPEYTQLTPGGSVNGRVLAPGQSMTDIPFPLMELGTPAYLNAVLSGDKLLYICAFVRYFDYTDTERILRFCYRFGGRAASYAWVQAGGSEYNRHT